MYIGRTNSKLCAEQCKFWQYGTYLGISGIDRDGIFYFHSENMEIWQFGFSNRDALRIVVLLASLPSEISLATSLYYQADSLSISAPRLPGLVTPSIVQALYSVLFISVKIEVLFKRM
jgi:hypothetical protein